VRNKSSILDFATLDLSNPTILLAALQHLRHSVVEGGQAIFEQWRSRIERQAFRKSCLNLAYYLALRRHDLRALQTALMPWGLSSLGRLEARVLPNLDSKKHLSCERYVLGKLQIDYILYMEYNIVYGMERCIRPRF
jgi:pyruvate kinase